LLTLKDAFEQKPNIKGIEMNRNLLIAILIAAASLAACNKPTVVTVPSQPVPGPAGPAGPTGNQGNQGNDGAKGDTGKTGDSSTVIVTPAQPTAAPTPAPESSPKQ
jgi:hypothetical protein